MVTECFPRDDRSDTLLELGHVTIIREGVTVLHDISLHLGRNEKIGILGPNGSGKSTLIKVITRELYPASTGDEYVFRMWGRETWDVFDLRSRFGIVSHDLYESFQRDITVMETLLSGFFSSIGLFNHHVTAEMRELATKTAGLIGITHLMDRSMIHLSSGECRRVLIGRALVHSPNVLILDEPTGNLDLQALHTLRSHMRTIARRELAIILVTHQIHDIIPEIPRVLLMQDGRITDDGSKEEILTSEKMKALFQVQVNISQHEGYYYANGY